MSSIRTMISDLRAAYLKNIQEHKAKVLPFLENMKNEAVRLAVSNPTLASSRLVNAHHALRAIDWLDEVWIAINRDPLAETTEAVEVEPVTETVVEPEGPLPPVPDDADSRAPITEAQPETPPEATPETPPAPAEPPPVA